MAESEEEVDVLVQRVVKDISNAFKRNPNIDEIGVIPCPEARYNRSPIVLVENKLGVESWCIKFLLPYVHNKLLLYRQRKHWLDREALVDITSTLLLLNPDFTTAWNVRKELLQCGALVPEKDLYLGKLALTKFPKSPETWIHRRWVLQQVLQRFSAAACRSQQQHGEMESSELQRSPMLSDQLTRTLHEEMKVCCDAACRYPSNYNAWSHRIWVLQHMARGNIKFFHDELSSMRVWVSMHVSDHSGFHYRQFLLKELMTELSQAPTSSYASQNRPSTAPSSSPPHPSHTEANGELTGAEASGDEERQLNSATVLQLFHQELELCSDLIQSFPGHETLWSHRRHVFYLWHLWRRDLEHHCSCNGDAEAVYASSDSDLQAVGLQSHVNGQPGADEAMEVEGTSLPDPHDSKRLKRGVPLPDPPSLTSEYGFVSGVLDSCCNHEQKRFAAAYKKWIDTVVNQAR
ncbi:protein prenyltransferase alpha subunit repeat-containing protein 1 [Takifugu rubripes]|uniref:Protein prenyltransferase alpha subunit repeat containing 1 n=1 Tax=Takifugu rubripes TaxID=31033 RepID=A0A674NHW1_TAKRU|nr:protein prenyltransferase alpha subunit repeat-containing protein 1 [Takifugu rubripes]|eukprot:XP_003974803.1 PREDICTED: protein prenyltransferase alpha subunit repeat-containing protein 1 [Takifugu rubripes]